MIRTISLMLLSLVLWSCTAMDREPVSTSTVTADVSLGRFSKEELALQAKKNASLQLARYVKLVGNEYVLDITEADAAKLGVDPVIYQELQREVDGNNKLMAAELAKDSTMKLPDPQAIVKKLENYNNEKVRKRSTGI